MEIFFLVNEFLLFKIKALKTVNHFKRAFIEKFSSLLP